MINHWFLMILGGLFSDRPVFLELGCHFIDISLPSRCSLKLVEGNSVSSRKRRPHHRRQDLGLVLKLTADKDPEATTIVKIAGHGSLDMEM